MKLPDYHAPSQKWDEYRRFHCKTNRWFVRFESGEAVITTDSFDPSERRTITGTDLRIVSTSDSDCPKLKLDPKAPDHEATLAAFKGAGYDLLKVYEKPLPKAWLHVGCSQTLLFDTTTGRTVALNRGIRLRHKEWDSVPGWLRSGDHRRYYTAYLPGNDRGAIASRIELKVPYKPHAVERQYMRELRSGCSAWCNIVGNDTAKFAPRWYASDKGYRYIYHQPFTITEKGVPDLDDLSNEQKFQIARFGYTPGYHNINVDHLKGY